MTSGFQREDLSHPEQPIPKEDRHPSRTWPRTRGAFKLADMERGVYHHPQYDILDRGAVNESGWFYGKGALAHYYTNVEHKNFATFDTACGRYTNGIGSEGLVPWIAGKRCGDCLQKAR